MAIQIRVQEQQARRAIKNVEGDLNRVKRTMATTSAASSAMAGGASASMVKWGSQVQWAGRQLMYNFSIPLGIAGIAATNFALKNEKAMVRVAKVYGDNSEIFNRLAEKELPALQGAFEALSNTFGVQQDQVIQIAGDWAAAGATGLALAKVTESTLKAMVLGEMSATEATEALISIQAQYGQDSEGLIKTLNTLNMVENETGITMQGLIQGLSRAAGVARSAGVDVEHLSAMMAALTPASGSAANAGNALKTILSRVMSPTKEAAEVMGLMGVNTKDMAWQSLNGAQRIELLAKNFEDLSDSQKAVVSSVIASRWQINRFDVLMRDIMNTNGYYQRSLNATADANANAAQAQKELNKVLESNPQRLQQMWTILQNAMADVIQPMIPWIVYLASEIANLATSFSNLDPWLQKFIIFAAAALAIIGPLARYIGAVGVLFGTIGTGLKWLAGVVPMMGLFSKNTKAAGGAVADTAEKTKKMGGAFGFLSKLPGIFDAAWTAVVAVTRGAGATLVGLSQGIAVAVGLSFRNIGPLMLLGVKGGFVKVGQVIAGFWPTILGVLKKGGVGLIRVLLGPWGLAITAILAVLSSFWGEITDFFGQLVRGIGRVAPGIAEGFAPLAGWFSDIVQNIIGVFYKLPQGVQDAFIAVVNIVRDAALAVHDWFSWMNPFVRHSPALVEAVQAGFKIIRDEYNSVSNLGKPFREAAKDLAVFKKMATQAGGGEFGDERKDVKAAMPDQLPRFDRLVKTLGTLNSVLRIQEALVAAQEAVVDRWADKLDAANAALDKQQGILDTLQDNLQGLQDQYQGHSDALQNYANADIKGMRAASDAVFQNEMAQKKLRLEILKMGDAGQSIDDIKSKMSSLQGDIEALRGRANDLRSKGAGSDVLGPINAQIAEMEKAYKDLEKSAGAESPAAQLQKQLEELEKQGQIMDLENSLKFDPLTRQIQQAADTSKELTFKEIIDGIKGEQDAMASLTPQINAAQAAYDAQAQKVKDYQAARDAVSASYDAEQKKLETLRDEYQKTADAISEIEQALRSVGSVASEMPGGSAFKQKAKEAADAKKAKARAKSGGADKLSPGAQNFLDAAGGEFPDVGSDKLIGREGGLTDQSKLIDEYTKDLQDRLKKSMSDLNPFQGLQEAWGKFQSWWSTNVTPAWNSLVDGIKSLFAGIDFSGFTSRLEGIGQGFKNAWDTISTIFGQLADLFGPQIKEIFDRLGDALGPAFQKVSDAVGPLWDDIGGLFGAIGDMWTSYLWPVLKVALAFIGGTLVAGISTAFSIIGNVIGPVITFIGDAISAIVTIIRGVIKVISGLIKFVTGIVQGFIGFFKGIFTGDWSGFQAAGKTLGDAWSTFWTGLVTIGKGAWDAIVAVFQGAWDTVYGIVSGFVEGVVDFFTWLWDVLVGHSIIPDTVNAILDWFQTLWDDGVALIKGLVEGVVGWFENMWTGIKDVWKLVTDKITAVATWVGSTAVTAFKNSLGFIKEKFTNFRKAVGAIWNLVTDKIKAVWTWIKDTAAKSFWTSLGFIRDKFTTLKTKVAEIWESIKSKVKAVWTWIKETAATSFWTSLSFVRDKFTTLKTKIAEIWEAIKGKIKAVWTWISDTASKSFGTALDKIKAAFGAVKDGIKTIWDKIKGIAAKPINFMIETVYMGGIRPLVGKVFDWLKKPNPLPEMSKIKEFAVGGWTGPGQKYKPAGVVHADEFVVRKESRSKFERNNPGALDYLNKHGKLPGYAGGGSVEDLKRGVKWWQDKGARVSEFGAWGQPVHQVHMANSLHYSNRAADLNYGPGGTSSAEQSFFDRNLGRFRSLFPNLHVLWRVADHFNHMHIDNSGADSPGQPAANFWNIITKLKDLKNKFKDGLFDSQFGKMLTSAGKNLINMPIDWVKDKIGSVFGGGDSSDDPGDSAVVAQVKNAASKYGWNKGKQWDAIDWIVNKESSWNPYAKNPGSSAAGLFQKMQSVHGLVEPTAYGQAVWGLNYIKGRYGNPVAAKNFHQSHGYYANGGLVELAKGGLVKGGRGGVHALIGEGRNDELVTPLPSGWQNKVRQVEQLERRAQATTTTNNYNDNRVININGNLEFPNIKTADDSKAFIQSIYDLAD